RQFVFPPFPNRWPITGQLFFSSLLPFYFYKALDQSQWISGSRKKKQNTLNCHTFGYFPPISIHNIALMLINKHQAATQGLIKVGRCWQPYDYVINA
ncbi:hypothetical protein VN97_g10804, partial [Penicillium thymicola]